jgi:hypothetical protein
MTTVRMLPKCSDGYCGWRGCWEDATSRVLRLRIGHNTVVDVMFCCDHRRFAFPGSGAAATTIGRIPASSEKAA